MTTADITIDTGTNELLCAIRDRVAVITLNRPEARNALSDHLTPALRTMIKSCGENPDVGALLITGAGTAFCAGGDVKGMGAHRDPKKLAMSFDEKVADLQERQRLLTGALTIVGALSGGGPKTVASRLFPSAKISPPTPSIHGRAVIARELRLNRRESAPCSGLVLPSASTCLLIAMPLL